MGGGGADKGVCGVCVWVEEGRRESGDGGGGDGRGQSVCCREVSSEQLPYTTVKR